jgi:hypothetical protein
MTDESMPVERPQEELPHSLSNTTSNFVSGGVNMNSQGNTNIQDVVGRDKITIVVPDQEEARDILRANQYLRLDRELFQKIRDMLPSDRTIKFVREQDYGGPFLRKAHDNLRKFRDFSQLPECEFMDPELETVRTHLEESVNQFLDVIANHAFTLETNIEFSRLERDPYEDPAIIAYYRKIAKSERQFDELMAEQQKRVYALWHETNMLANQLCNAHDEFVRLGRRRLAIDIQKKNVSVSAW